MRKGTLRSLAVIICLCLMVSAFSACNTKTEEPSSEAETTQQKNVEGAQNPLTGEMNLSKNAVGNRPIAVMINNIPVARPQWGLCSPDIVVEGLVEGGATRMMWLYANVDDIPEKIGSVRSARHDFVELATGFDAFFIHWGGSTYAYDSLQSIGLAHIDGQTNKAYYGRDTSTGKAREHTGYITGGNIKKAMKDKDIRTKVSEANKSPFTFAKESRDLTGQSCKKVYVPFSQLTSHTFEYKAADKKYYNFIDGAPMTQSDGQQMAVENVLILYTGISSMNDAAGCIDMNLSSGKGIYINGGKSEEIIWKKGNATNTLTLQSKDGTALLLNAGKSWIGLVPASLTSSVTIS